MMETGKYPFTILYMCRYYTQFHPIRRDNIRRKIMKKKTVSLLLVAAMAVGMLAGCGGGKENREPGY